MEQYIKINNQWKRISSVYKKIQGHWVKLNTYDFDNNLYLFNSAVVDVDLFTIEGVNTYTGKQFYLIAKVNDRRVNPTWSITSGSEYATINSSGKVVIDQSADENVITVQASFGGAVKTKNITVSYDNQFTIEGSDTMTGTSGNVIALYNYSQVTPTWSITSGVGYATIDSNGSITILDDGEITVSASYNNYTATKTITLVYAANQSSQTEVDPVTGSVTNTETTTEVDPETGAITETSTSTTTAEDGSALSETVTETVINEDGSSTSQSSTVTYDEDGNTASTTESTATISAADSEGVITTEISSTTTNADGTSEESNSTIIENEDGSSSSSSETIRYDENGDPTGSTTNTTEVNSDGSSESSTTNYNAEGNPTDQQNVGVDTTGNVDTQDVEFDENGDPTVTGYTIDTTASEGEGKAIEGNGIDTEFVPFNFASEGFVLHIVFETRSIDQPRPPLVTDIEDSGTNWHYTILGAKMTTTIHDDVTGKDIWPGFEIRWSIPTSGNGSNGTLNFGRTLYGESSSTRTTFTGGHNGQNVYDITVTYDPNQATHKFVVYNNYTHATLQDVNKTLQNDVDLDLTIGYSFDHNGDPMRHSNVTIHDFSVSRLS